MKERDAGVEVMLYGSPEGAAKLEVVLADEQTGLPVLSISVEWDVSKLHTREAVRLVREHVQEGVRHLGGYEVMEHAVTSGGGSLN